MKLDWHQERECANGNYQVHPDGECLSMHLTLENVICSTTYTSMLSQGVILEMQQQRVFLSAHVECAFLKVHYPCQWAWEQALL